MSDKDSGEKTEKATPKSLRDARRKGDIPKSRDLGNFFSLAFALVALWQLMKYLPERFAQLFEAVFRTPSEPFHSVLREVSTESIEIFIIGSALILIPLSIAGLLVELIQTGPIMTFEKIKPKLSHLNPVEGFKKMFSADNIVEFAKSVVHTAALFLLGWLAIRSAIPDVALLPTAEPLAILEALQYMAIRLFGWTLVIFALVTAIDTGYQHYSFARKMKMSVRDIKEEYKQDEGDPLLKSHRRQLAQEWAQEGNTGAAEQASVLVVNPTHIAIALRYDKEETPVPIVTGRGEDHVALEMRDAAEDNDVPVLRNEQLARALLRQTDNGDVVPRELFDVVAEVILWAQTVNERLVALREAPSTVAEMPLRTAPGQDLTRYRDEQAPKSEHPRPVVHKNPR